jgi:Tol biopolymer transport system component/DNA-binding winged helix-turn-helix (wHTH) protein
LEPRAGSRVRSGGGRCSVIRFGIYEADRHTGELRKSGSRIRLADQPFRVLIALLDRPGELVTRDELRQLLWADTSAGNFEQGLNRTVNKLRTALCDSAARPRLIETLPGHGYRFIGVVEREAEAAPGSAGPPQPRPQWLSILSVALAALIFGALGLLIRGLVPAPIPDLHWRKLTTDNFVKLPPALSDGSRLYFLANYGGDSFLAQVPIRGGQSARVPITLPGPVCNLQDLSRDGQEILLLCGTAVARTELLPLWTLQIAEGTAKRIPDVLATSASYSPTDGQIAYTTETEVWLIGLDSSRRKLLEFKDSVLGSVSWDPTGRIIRFARRNATSSQRSAWQIRADGSGLEEVLPQWHAMSYAPAGWSADREFEVFAAGGSFWFRRSGGWRRWHPDEIPTRTMDEYLDFSDKVRIRGRSSFVTVGVDRLGELQRFDTRRKAWVPLLDGVSAEDADFSRDGRHVAYVTYPQRTLWARDGEGKRPVQLTSPPMVVWFPRWSPDGKRIAFMGQAAGKQEKIYLVDADGGASRLAVPRDAAWQQDPNWSPDGKRLLYGVNAVSARETPYIRIANLDSGQFTELPGSGGLFAPRWSPDGTMAAALEWRGQHRLMLYRFSENRWDTATDTRADYPTWSADGRRLQYRCGDRLMELDIRDKRRYEVMPLNVEELGGYSHMIGRTFDDAPVRTLSRDTRQLFEIYWQ